MSYRDRPRAILDAPTAAVPVYDNLPLSVFVCVYACVCVCVFMYVHECKRKGRDSVPATVRAGKAVLDLCMKRKSRALVRYGPTRSTGHRPPPHTHTCTCIHIRTHTSTPTKMYARSLCLSLFLSPSFYACRCRTFHRRTASRRSRAMAAMEAAGMFLMPQYSSMCSWAVRSANRMSCCVPQGVRERGRGRGRERD
jgi:hypothetical protein